jgi:ADP-heptose:LPS heptosyltransferase
MPTRRLLLTFVRIGDLVMMTPLLRRLAADGPLEIVARPWAGDLLADQPWVAAVHGLATPHKGGSWLGGLIWGGDRRRLLARLSTEHYDECIVFARESPTVRRWAALVAAATGARLRELDLPLRGAGHVVDRIPACLTGGGFDLAGFAPEPSLDVSPAARSAGAELLRRLAGGADPARTVVIQAGSSLTDRRWRRRPNLKGLSHAQWGRFIGRLLAEDPAGSVVLLGSANEADEAAAVRAACPPTVQARVHVGTGVPLRGLPGLFASARAGASVDTGPGHIAAAAGCSLLSIFGPTDPGTYRPRGAGRVEVLLGKAPCQFCHGGTLWDTCAANVCLTGLDDAVIWAAWERLRA